MTKVIPPKRRHQIEEFVFESLPKFSSIESVGKIGKMAGYKNYYKIRFGEYRIGIILTISTIELKRIRNRKEIYKLFP